MTSLPAGSGGGGAAGSAATGAAAGANGGMSGGAAAGANAGMGANEDAVQCPSSGMSIPLTEGPFVRQTFQGDNGTFQDSCENGNLVEYSCEYTTSAGPPGDPGPFFQATGAVIPNRVDCGGRCSDGVCPDICPNVGDTVRYLSIAEDNSASFEDITTGRNYDCQFQGMTSGYDCQSTRAVGDEFVITGDYHWSGCAAFAGFSVGELGVAACAYTACVPTAP